VTCPLFCACSRCSQRIAMEHRAADERCGRDWDAGGCQCGACREARKVQAAEANAKPYPRVEVVSKKAKTRQHRHGLQLHLDGAYVWRKNHGVFACKRCQTWINFDGKEMVYSHDAGKSWTPGPDACPGRRP
jgi:hypothetical protein